jgi:glyoxylase-like metal-dependent hydrolase (beta-lactamase superfamily II)
MKKATIIAALFCLAWLPIRATSRQQALSVGEKSCAQARQILDQGIKAAGGLKALQAIENVSRKLEGHRVELGQAFKPDVPYTTQPFRLISIIDFKNERSFAENSTAVLGGLQIALRQVVKDRNTAFSLNLHTKTLNSSSPGGIASGRSTSYRYPEVLLTVAASRFQTLRYLGEESEGGKRFQVITFSDPFGQQITLYFNAQSGLLTKAETIKNEPVFSMAGELGQQFIFSDYRQVNGFKFPYRHTTRYVNEVLDELRLTEIQVNSNLSNSLFEAPEGYEKSPPSPIVNPQLAEGVYLIPGNYNIMFVVFQDYVLVIEAPLGDALTQKTLAEIKQAAPNKPVKYVVATHYHHDHIGGLRGYIAEGTTIVTTADTKKEIEKLAATQRPITPDTLSHHPRPPVIETFADKRVFSDRTRTVELYNIGPSPHVNELLIAYFPKEKMVFVADVFDFDAGQLPPAADHTLHFAETIKKLGLQVETIVPAHGMLATMDDLNKTITLRKAKQ